MNFVLGKTNIITRSWDSKGEMSIYLQSCNEGSCILGEDAQQEKEYYSITVHYNWNKLRSFGIGIICEGHGLIPVVFLDHSSNLIICGFNNKIIGFNVNTKAIAFEIRLESLFTNLLYINNYNIMLVFHEIGVIAINNEGIELWNYSKDIITDAIIENSSYILLNFMDSESIKLRLSDGAVIPA